MYFFVIKKETSEIEAFGSCDKDQLSLQFDSEKSYVITSEEEISFYTHKVVNNVIVNRSETEQELLKNKPSNFHNWDQNLNNWVDSRSINQMREYRWADLKENRNQALTAPLVTPYGIFDADTLSQKNITDAIQLLQTLETQQPNQTIDFTLSDNTVVTLTTEQMVNVGLALGQRTQQIYNTSRQLRTQLDLAQTKQEVEAITWPT